jgi:hypothetical protein
VSDWKLKYCSLRIQVEVEVWANEFSDTRDAYDVRLSKFTKCGGRLILTTCRWYYQIGLKKLNKELEDLFCTRRSNNRPLERRHSAAVGGVKSGQ